MFDFVSSEQDLCIDGLVVSELSVFDFVRSELDLCIDGLAGSLEVELSVFDFGGEVMTVVGIAVTDLCGANGECEGEPVGLLEDTRDIIVFDLKNGRGFVAGIGWWLVIAEEDWVVPLNGELLVMAE